MKRGAGKEGQGSLQNEIGGDVARSIRLPKTVWAALDKDAARCRRSSVKQLEALLVAYYELEDVEIEKEGLKKTKDRQSKEHKK